MADNADGQAAASGSGRSLVKLAGVCSSLAYFPASRMCCHLRAKDGLHIDVNRNMKYYASVNATTFMALIVRMRVYT